MNTSRLFALGLLAAGLGLVPAVAHAVGYSKYTSASCAYTVDQPVGWKASLSGTTVTFGGETSSSSYRAIILDCTKKTVTERALTASEMNAFRKEGYALSKATYTGHAGIFTGHKRVHNAGKTITELIEVTSFRATKHGYVIALAADGTKWKTALPVYVHVLTSFRGH